VSERYSQLRLKYAAPLSKSRIDGSPDDVRYLGLENIEPWTGRLLTGDARIIADNGDESVGGVSNCFEKGDVLFGKLRPYLAKAHLAEAPGICTTELLVLKPGAKIHGRFLLYALLTEEFINAVDGSTFGSKMPRADWDFIGNQAVPVPPLPTQRAIADYLDRETARLDALVAAKGRLLDLLAEKRRALITHAVTRGLDPAAPLKESGVEWLEQAPAHWSVKRLKHVVGPVEQGWSPQCDSFPAEENEWGVLKAGCVNGPELDALENKRLPDSETPLAELEIKPGDILMSRANTTELLGSAVHIKQVRPRLLLCDKLYRFRAEPAVIESDFLVHFLRCHSGRFVMERDATGASNSMQNIGQETIRNLHVPLPPLPEQRAIVAHIAAETAKLDALRAAAERSIALLRERRAALIAAAVTGKLALA
jgi:type I restriction enzyme S subunit